jgi:hypothetical protein
MANIEDAVIRGTTRAFVPVRGGYHRTGVSMRHGIDEVVHAITIRKRGHILRILG